MKNEVEKLQSLLITVARGGGEQMRKNVKCFLLGNNISMLNPYSVFFGFPQRLKKDTRFLRGHGWIAKFNFNESASNALKESGIFRAFNSDYMKTSADNVTLWKEDEFICKPSGKTKYLFTIKHNNSFFGVREDVNSCLVYVTAKHDPSCYNILTFNDNQHGANTIRLEKSSFTFKRIKSAYNNGLLRCENLVAKNVIIDILSIEFR